MLKEKEDTKEVKLPLASSQEGDGGHDDDEDERNNERSRSVSISKSKELENSSKADLIYTFGFKSLRDHTGEQVAVEKALQDKIVCLVFTTTDVNEPTFQNLTFTERCIRIMNRYPDDIAFVFVAPGDEGSPEEVSKLLENKPMGFYAVASEDLPTRKSLAEQNGISKSSLPSVIVINPQGVRISTWGRSAVLLNTDHCVAEWKANREGITFGQIIISRLFS